MTEVTRVPIKPVTKGSLTKLWLGIIVAIAIGAGIAWAAIPKGVSLETLVEGTGPTPSEGDVVFINYVGKLTDGTVFDESQDPPIPPGIFPKGNPFPIQEGAAIDGFLEGLRQVQKGGKYVLEIPAEKAYGANPPEGAPIPPNADLIFEIEVTEFMAEQDFQTRLGALQQMMQQQQGGEGGPGGPAGPGAPPAQ
ncbi:peptidylprolyl isomerase [Altererythrobacter sp. RZ02]|uniref:Peptidyl-prolyl cis-trans isomerase n=1 Tax=Pontixanthobacter rizhaonensis TaxID=2730337 RepID=A0A848QI89_9SPHN|nr:FKBP-type peptidyl-prolyl cis-trans isomerase [Pontixanthobacter rizhaonensis]NMW30724.1 peptidylprolyl isomerase [Pontixanthobacter rizhaonensis]